MNILIADDDRTSRLVLAATLKKLGHEVSVADNGREAWDRWQQQEVTLLISDWMMPDIDGPTLCSMIRGERRLHYTYIILLTTLAGRGRYLDGMRAGADDFITKPLDQEMLAARLMVAERILALHDQLREQALHDPLTGLLNRGAIEARLQQEIDRATRTGQPLGVLLADLDYFKQINDRHGHPAGDAVLCESARRMGAALRAYDAVGRYGGEEFLFVVPGCDWPGIVTLAHRLCQAVATTPVNTPVGPLDASASVGATLAVGGDGQNAEQLLAAADQALYQAKAAGRNRAAFVGHPGGPPPVPIPGGPPPVPIPGGPPPVPPAPG